MVDSANIRDGLIGLEVYIGNKTADSDLVFLSVVAVTLIVDRLLVTEFIRAVLRINQSNHRSTPVANVARWLLFR